MPPPSARVWFYFVKLDKKIAQCHVCCKEIRYCGTTSNLYKHIKSHGIVVPKRTLYNFPAEPTEEELSLRFEHFRKIAEANKAKNRTRQGPSVASTSAATAPRTAGQRNHSRRMVYAPDFVPSVSSSTSLVDPLILPGTSQAESILPTRVESESSSVALVYDPAKIIKKEVEEEIEEFGRESSPVSGEEQAQVLSDLNPENVKGIMLRLRAEKLLLELEKLKMDRNKVEAEKRNIILRTKVLELRKKLAGLDSYDESRRHASPPNDTSHELRLTDFSPLPNEHILLQTPETVEKDPLSDINTVVRKVSIPQRKSAVSEGSKRTLARSKLRKSIKKRPVQQEVCQMRTTSFVAMNQTYDVLPKSSAEGSDVLDISEDSLSLHGNNDIKKGELCNESLDSNLESLIAEKKRKALCSETQSVPETGERREVTETLLVHGIDPTGSGGTYVGIAGSVAKRKKFSKGPT